MKCVDCGKDAVCIASDGDIVEWAFCKSCIKKRYKIKTFSHSLETEDIFDDLLKE